MRRNILRESVLLLAVALFVISSASVAVSGQDIETTKTINGSILGIHVDTGMVEVRDEAGEIMNLKAGSDIDLKTLSGGDRVSIDYSSDGVIKSITEQE